MAGDEGATEGPTANTTGHLGLLRIGFLQCPLKLSDLLGLDFVEVVVFEVCASTVVSTSPTTTVIVTTSSCRGLTGAALGGAWLATRLLRLLTLLGLAVVAIPFIVVATITELHGGRGWGTSWLTG
jgi:hypothetical protein